MRPEKLSIIEELRGRIRDAEFMFLADYRGMSVAHTETLRRQLQGVGAHAQVVPNRLFRRSGQDVMPAGLEAGLKGPSLLVCGKGDVTQAAKILKAFIKENERPVIKLGAMQGSVLSPADVEALAALPAREVMLSMLLGTLAAPMTQLVGVLQQKVASIVYVLKAVEEKKGPAPAP